MASIFIGPGGLRAGWRFLLFVLGIELAEFYLRGPLLSLLSRKSGVNLDELSAPALFIEELVGLVSVLLVTGIAALLERRRVDGYGLPVAQAFGKLFWKGMLAGLLVVVFVAVAMIATGAMKVHGLALNGIGLPWFGLLWLGANGLVGLNEDISFVVMRSGSCGAAGGSGRRPWLRLRSLPACTSPSRMRTRWISG
jgi:hypothetical protein